MFAPAFGEEKMDLSGEAVRRHVASQMLTRLVRTLVRKYLSARRALLPDSTPSQVSGLSEWGGSTAFPGNSSFVVVV